MRKLLVVMLIGMALAINVYGFINQLQTVEIDAIEDSTTEVVIVDIQE